MTLRIDSPSRYWCDPRSVRLVGRCLTPANETHRRRLRPEAEFLLVETKLLKDMDPRSGHAVCYFPPTSTHVLHWRDDNRRSTIIIQFDDLNEGVSIVSFARGLCAKLLTHHTSVERDQVLAVFGPCILYFWVRFVEVYPIPTDTPNPLCMHRDPFGPVCFRAVSLPHTSVVLPIRSLPRDSTTGFG